VYAARPTSDPRADVPRVTLPRTEAAAREVLSLPIYPELSSDDARAIAALVREALGHG